MIRATANGLAAGDEIVIPLQFSMNRTTESINSNNTSLTFCPCDIAGIGEKIAVIMSADRGPSAPGFISVAVFFHCNENITSM